MQVRRNFESGGRNGGDSVCARLRSQDKEGGRGCPICYMSVMRELPKPILLAKNRSKVLRALELMLEELKVEENRR